MTTTEQDRTLGERVREMRFEIDRLNNRLDYVRCRTNSNADSLTELAGNVRTLTITVSLILLTELLVIAYLVRFV